MDTPRPDRGRTMLARLRAVFDFFHQPDVPGRDVDWIAVGIFFAVAIGWSWFACRWTVPSLPGGVDAPRLYPLMLIAVGPLIGAVVAGSIRKNVPLGPVSFLGPDRRWAWGALVVPMVVLGAIGAERYRMEPHVDAAVWTGSLLLACAAQEIGWREWLYNALGGWPLWATALVTWVMWLVWHLAFVPVIGDAMGGGYDIWFTAGLLAASFALAGIVRATHSSAIAAVWATAIRAEAGHWATAVMLVLLAALTWRATRRRLI